MAGLGGGGRLSGLGDWRVSGFRNRGGRFEQRGLRRGLDFGGALGEFDLVGDDLVGANFAGLAFVWEERSSPCTKR